MKIAFFADTHLGYARFEEDSYVQAENIIMDASKKADALICAGDIFDTKIPKLETIKRAIDIFNKASCPVYIIHGNHERRMKELVNPAQLLAAATKTKILHGNQAILEKDEEKVQVFGLGSIPEEYAEEALKRVLANFKADASAFKILIIHQSIRELMAVKKEDELSLEYLETLPFDLIVNGHIHETTELLGGKLLIPGSTVVTQLKKEQMTPRGYFLYDTKLGKYDFVPVNTRKIICEEILFENANEGEMRLKIKERIETLRSENPNAIISIKVQGTASGNCDLNFGYENVFVDNKLESANLTQKLEEIRRMRGHAATSKELAISELKKKTEGKVKLFDSGDLFETLGVGVEETVAYLEKKKGTVF